jgi:tetratricopeptide (TPR) repeat protein
MTHVRVRAVVRLLLPVLAGAGINHSASDAGVREEWIARIDSLRVASMAESALVVIGEALPTATRDADSTLILGLWVRQGELETSLGRARQGEVVLRRARALASQLGDSARVCSSLRWLSVAVGSQGRTDEADGLCRELLTLATIRRDTNHQAWARVGLAWNAAIRGRGDDAMREYRVAAELFHGGRNPRGEAWARNGLGIALAGAGRYEEARRSYQDAERLARQADYLMVVGLAANNLGALEYSLGDPGTAVRHFRDALLIRRQIGNLREAIIPGINLALCDSELGRLDAASDSLESLLRTCRAEGYVDLEAKALGQLADTRGLQGRGREARALYRSILSMGSMAPTKNRVEAATGLASSLAEADSGSAALALLEDALGSLDRQSDPAWRIRIETRIGELLLDRGAATAGLPHLCRALELSRELNLLTYEERALMDLGRAHSAAGRTDSAEVVWVDAAAVWEEIRSTPTDPEWREARGAEGRSLSTDMITLLLDRSRGRGLRDRIRDAYDRAQRFKTRTLLERMRGPGGLPSRFEEPPTLDRMQSQLLGDGELFLDFFLGPRASYLFTVSRDSCQVEVLPAESVLAPMVLLYYDLLRTPPGPDASASALHQADHALRSVLFGSAAPRIRSARRVYVAPDGVLNVIPFGIEEDDARAETDWIRVPSAAVFDLLHSRSRDAPLQEHGILAFAGGRTAHGELRGAVAEVEDLADHYRGTNARFLTPVDTVCIEDFAKAPAVLHVASHSRADDQRPWLSTIDLGASSLRADEIAASHIAVRLAVLSSCQTQHGRVMSGEGTLGLSAALLSAGAECVVATLWPVDDRTTAEFMRHFYRGLAAGETVSGAIRHAQAVIRGSRQTAHPFYWAGFVSIGRGECSIPLEVRAWPRVRGGVLAASAICLAVGTLLVARGRRRTHSVTVKREQRLMG